MPERYVVAEDADAVVRQVHAAAKAVITEARTSPGHLARLLMTRMHEVCERLAMEALASGPRIACGPGCHWCCTEPGWSFWHRKRW